MSAREIIAGIGAEVGIGINGREPWDMKVHNERTFERILGQGSVGLGESYMVGWWDCEDLYGFFERLLSLPDIQDRVRVGLGTMLAYLKARLTNVQSVAQTRRLADTHYNLGNALFEGMLGPSMAYSCGYWRKAADLDGAQLAKYDLVCRKLKLARGEHLLDIGCGWGGFARFAVENYGVRYTGITVAAEQAEYARRLCAGLPVEIDCVDYREFDIAGHGGPFDKLVSIGMIEHVGYRNYANMMEVASRALKEKGLFLLHMIGSTVSLQATDPWIDKYIFPGGVLPSVKQISEAAEKRFVLHDAQNIGVHYAPTLVAWHRNFETWWETSVESERPRIRGSQEMFRRMWRYYLLSCAASFATGYNEVWQFVYARGHLPEGYDAVR